MPEHKRKSEWRREWGLYLTFFAFFLFFAVILWTILSSGRPQHVH
jgi:hypothetical protein